MSTTTKADDMVRQGWCHFSDHLPVGAKFGSGLSVVTANLLAKAYMKWIHRDGQWLNKSCITELHDDEGGWACAEPDPREVSIVSFLDNLMANRVGILALQEVSYAVYQKLVRAAKTRGYRVMCSTHVTDGILFKSCVTVVYNLSILRATGDVYRAKQRLQMSFEHGPQRFVLVNAHVPFGEENSTAFDEYIHGLFQTSPDPVIVMGDFNVDAREFATRLPHLGSVAHCAGGDALNHVQGPDHPEEPWRKMAKYDYVCVRPGEAEDCWSRRHAPMRVEAFGEGAVTTYALLRSVHMILRHAKRRVSREEGDEDEPPLKRIKVSH